MMVRTQAGRQEAGRRQAGGRQEAGRQVGRQAGRQAGRRQAGGSIVRQDVLGRQGAQVGQDESELDSGSISVASRRVAGVRRPFMDLTKELAPRGLRGKWNLTEKKRAKERKKVKGEKRDPEQGCATFRAKGLASAHSQHRSQKILI